MTITSSPTGHLDETGRDSTTVSWTQRLYWSVRREIWENRSLYVAPLVVMAFVIFGLFINLFGLPRKMQTFDTLTPARQQALLARPFGIAPAPIMLTTFLVAFFYLLDALYGERRDRSILFWKSLPVSDLTTVLSKAAIPLLVLPVIAWILSLIAVIVLFVLSSMILAGAGISPTILWSNARLGERVLIMAYGLCVHVLWFAPIYGWVLMISGWAKRTPILWVLLPPVAINVLERVAFNTSYFQSFIVYRLKGAMTEAFVVEPNSLNRISQLSPLRFFTSGGLWLGLIFAAACFGAAVYMRRNREPI